MKKRGGETCEIVTRRDFHAVGVNECTRVGEIEGREDKKTRSFDALVIK